MRPQSGPSPRPSARGFLLHKFLRILTLVCFFHFSGLNNGFTTLVVCAGQIQRADIAPLLAQKVVASLHPLHWKIGFAKVIGLSSQRAVQYMLMESSYIQNWVLESCVKQNALVGARHASNAAIDLQISGPEPQAPAFFSPQIGREVSVKCLPRYFKTGRKPAWLMDRCHFWNGQNMEKWQSQETSLIFSYLSISDGGIPLQLKKSVRRTPEKLRIWLCSSLSRDGDDPHSQSIELNTAENPGPQDRGSSFPRGDA